MTLTFHYKTVQRPDGTEVKTPAIPIVLQGKEKMDTIALLDSGADVSAMSKAIADILGLDLKGKKGLAYGLGGKVEAVDSEVHVIVAKGHERYSFDIPVKVILGDYDFPMLLGRLGFFERFIVSFDQNNERVSLKKVNRG